MDNITFIILILTITVAVVVRFLMFSKPFSKEAIEGETEGSGWHYPDR